MRKAAVHGVHEQDADVVAALGLQSPCGGVGHIAQLIRDVQDAGAGIFPDVRLTVEGLADRSRRNAAAFRDVLQRYHRNQPLLLNRFRSFNVPHFCENCKYFLGKNLHFQEDWQSSTKTA